MACYQDRCAPLSAVSFNIWIVRTQPAWLFKRTGTYTPRPLNGSPLMEPNKIKEEVTALQTRFDALRGYL